ncbi:MAG: isoleucyl-tRNA synthetase, partial [Yoonia sp.]
MCADTPEYKSTLNLPKTDFPMRAGLPKREPEWLDRWNTIGVYDRLRDKAVAEKRPPFTLHDGPPYANGHLHIGHALNKILKDFVVRSQQMMGKDARYIPGWDCHGLPIEWKIEEKYRNKGRDKDDVPVVEFRQECREFAAGWVDIQREEFKRLGVTGKWENPYLTMDFHAERVIAEEFQKFLMNGTLYQGSKPVMWSPVEKTALAEAEVEYHDRQTDAIWVKFPVVSRGAAVLVGLDRDLEAQHNRLNNASVVIWTTTPWTIPQNRAICFNPKVSYGLYEVMETEVECWATRGEILIIADDLADAVFTA